MKFIPPFRLLACLLLLVVCPPLLAKPALWVVKDADTTIYLFGTVHLLPGDTNWRYPALDKALADSQTIYLEVIDDDPVTMTALVLKHGMDASNPLSTKLTPREQHQLRLLANKLDIGGGVTALNMMRPWLASLTLAMAPLLKAGLNPDEGVDRRLRSHMADAGKTILGLETAEEQVRFLADLPRPMELALLRSTMRDADKGPIQLTELIGAWKRGDTDTIARIQDKGLRDSEPALYDRLLVQRNREWARAIAAMLEQPGTVFIAVGAGHLAGDDSVQEQLKHDGITVTRL